MIERLVCPASRLLDAARSSLLVLPVAAVLGGVALGSAATTADATFDLDPRELPVAVASTVESARSVLSTIATATITVAGIAFSVSLLVIQMASSQYAPQVVQSMFRDPFNRRAMSIVLGTFTYCLVVLRTVRAPIGDGGPPDLTISVTLGVVLGITSVLTIVAFIDHSARSMDVSHIIDRVTSVAEQEIPRSGGRQFPGARRSWTAPSSTGVAVGADADGWVRHVDVPGLLRALPDGSVVGLTTWTGDFVARGTPLARVWPPGEDADEDADELADAVRRSFHVGKERTVTGDAEHGVLQLSEVAVRSMSPGVNNPATAVDAAHHLGALLRAMLRCERPPAAWTCDDRTVGRIGAGDPADLLERGFGELRRCSAGSSHVCRELVGVLAGLRDTVVGTGDDDAREAIEQQARLVVEGCLASGGLDHDRDALTNRYQACFGVRRSVTGS